MQVILPASILAAAGLLLLLLRLFGIKRDGAALGIALAALAGAIIVLFACRPDHMGLAFFSGTITLDPLGLFLQMVVYLGCIVTLLLSWDYIREGGWGLTEYCAIMLFSAVGMAFLMISTDLLSLYIGLELMALGSYVLAGYARGEARSFEASMKYFILGAFSSGVLLYGISLIYGATGTLNLMEIARVLPSPPGKLFMAGMVMLACGMLFKVAAIPFHMWTPDVYQGAPTPITTFFATGPKVAAFAAFLRIFSTAFAGTAREWTVLIGLACILTMVGGNLMAIVQNNVKRMMAYSSIGSAGFLLLAILAQNDFGRKGLIYYLFAYLFANAGVFAVIIYLKSKEYAGEAVDDFKGLNKAHPFTAFAMLVFLLSLTGIPGTAGFVGKFYLFGGAIQGGYIGLAVVGVLMSAVSAYYYFRLIVNMYISEGALEGERQSLGIRLALGVCLVGTLVFGLWPTGVINFLSHGAIIAQ
jgi:NADH-quinone oxidoreductase subunit N